MYDNYEPLLELAEISQEDIDLWKALSARLIELDGAEKVSDEGFYQGIDRAAYHIAQIAFKSTLVDGIPPDMEDVVEEMYSEEMNTLDEALHMIAIGHGTHPAIINVLVDQRVKWYTEQWIETFLPKRR